jgi:putative spermidine/putrescine transport system permease protein
MALFSLLSGNPMQRPNVTFTARHYARILDDSLYVESLASTLKIGAVTTAAALLLGYPLAHWLARMRSRAGHALLLMAVIAPMLTGIVVRTFAWITILSDKGVINATLMAAGRHRDAAAADVQRARHGDRARGTSTCRSWC